MRRLFCLSQERVVPVTTQLREVAPDTDVVVAVRDSSTRSRLISTALWA